MPNPQNDEPDMALAEISIELGAIFDDVVESIGAIRVSAGEFASSVGVLQGLGDTCDRRPDSAEDASFAAFSLRAEHAAAAAETAAAELDDNAFQAGLRSLAVILGELKRNTVELAAISSLTKIAKTESPAVADRLSVFTETLDKRFSDLRDSTSKAATMIDSIRTECSDARAALVAIAGELRHISRDAGADGAELESLRQAHLAEVDLMVSESCALGAQVQSAVGCVIACLQFPDAFAQRIAHVRAILAALDASDDVGEKSVLAQITVAQLDAMSDALVEAADAAVVALATIPLPHDESLSGTGDSDAAFAWIEAERRANEVMIRAVAGSRNRLDAAVTLISRIVSAVDTVRGMLEDSRRQNLELNISVHNASIVASRHGGGASALHVLAGGVKAVVAKVSHGVARIFEDLARIRSASEALQDTPLSAELNVLGSIQELAAHKADEDSAKLARATEAREQLLHSAEKLASAATEGRHRFGAARAFAEPLRDIAARIREGHATDSAPADMDLAWVEALYTMNEERDVHRDTIAAIGLVTSSAPATETAAAPESADADLEDFLL